MAKEIYGWPIQIKINKTLVSATAYVLNFKSALKRSSKFSDRSVVIAFKKHPQIRRWTDKHCGN